MTADVTAFFHDGTYTIAYVVSEPEGEHCAIVDSVLDYDPVSGRTTTDSADILIGFLRERGLTLDWILETHAHADHLTAAPYLQEKLGGRIAIGEHRRRSRRSSTSKTRLSPTARSSTACSPTAKTSRSAA